MSLQRISFAEACAFSAPGERTFFGSNGLFQTAAAGVPRFDYDPVTLAPKGILIEGTRTKLLSGSTELASRSGEPGVTVVESAIAGPGDGTFGDLLIEGTLNQRHHKNRTATIAANSWHTAHVICKPHTRRHIGLSYGKAGSPFTRAGMIVNLDTGTYTEISVGSALGVVRRPPVFLADGWVLVTISVLIDATSTDGYFEIYPSDGTGTTRTGDGASGIYIFNMQIEPGHFGSSTTVTAGTSLTTAADILTVQPAQFAAAFRQDAGTILIDMTLNHTGLGPTGLGDFPFLLDMDSAAAPEDGYRMVASANYGPGYKIEVKVGGSLVAGPTFVKALGGGSRTKLALAWGGANDFAACMDGGAVATDTSGAIPTPDRLSIGCQSGVNAQMFGHVRKVLFYPQRLTNAQLQEATA